jgi:4-hydroxy-3-methylbut-2-en-1-yl diphosphate synthase IspG/GcpE
MDGEEKKGGALHGSTGTKSFPIHFHIGNLPDTVDQASSLASLLSGERVSRVWAGVSAAGGADVVRELSSRGFQLTAAVGSRSLIEPCILAGSRGIALEVGPLENPDAVEKTAKGILRHRELFEKAGCELYLRASRIGISGLRALYHALSKGGIKNLSFDIASQNPVHTFNAVRTLREREKTRHICTLRFEVDSEENLIRNALLLGPLLYGGCCEALLVEPEHGRTPDGSIIHRAPDGELIRRALARARLLLSSLGLAPSGLRIISCPTCGRCSMDLTSAARLVGQGLEELERRLRAEGKHAEDSGGLTVAVMGCSVNGPGEARAADIGVAGRKDRSAVLFMQGRVVASVSEERLVPELLERTEQLLRKRLGGN